MCLNCGCGDPTRRQRPTDITLVDLRRAADGSHTSIASVIRNLREPRDVGSDRAASPPGIEAIPAKVR